MDTKNGVIKRGPIATIFCMMMNPRLIMESSLKTFPWYVAALVSGLAFATFFMQTGYDLYKTGQESLMYAIKLTGLGAAFGLVGMPIISIIVWPILKLSKTESSLTNTVKFVCLSYSGALIYGLVGIAFSLILGWRTALTFGATGVLWSMGPLMISFRKALKDKLIVAVLLTTLVGAAILFAWQFLQLV